MELRVEDHVNFLKGLLSKKDSFEFLQMAHLKTSVIYWSLTASTLLSALDHIYPEEKRQAVLAYLEKCYGRDGGFSGNEGAHDSHLLFTLSAVQIMVILLGRGTFPTWFNLESTVQYVLGLQDSDSGAFKGDLFGEIDTRFTYCAVATLSLLNSLDSLSASARSSTISFIKSCQNFDGGFGAVPGSESHGGNIFCCISALRILDAPTTDLESDALLEWLVWRQLPSGGFNGRPEKLADVCYSWWILSTLSTLSAVDHINKQKLTEFIIECQDAHGGFADRPEDVGDVFHTLFGLTGLSLLEHPQVKVKIDPLYCLPFDRNRIFIGPSSSDNELKLKNIYIIINLMKRRLPKYAQRGQYPYLTVAGGKMFFLMFVPTLLLTWVFTFLSNTHFHQNLSSSPADIIDDMDLEAAININSECDFSESKCWARSAAIVGYMLAEMDRDSEFFESESKCWDHSHISNLNGDLASLTDMIHHAIKGVSEIKTKFSPEHLTGSNLQKENEKKNIIQL